jgi:ATP-dependent protease ClpP protease subunit
MTTESNHKIDHKLKAKSDDPLYHLHEYDVDLKSNHIYLFGVENYISGAGGTHDEEPGIEYVIANRFIRNMNLCMRVNPDKPIVIHMKTNGGYWEEGMAIYDMIKSCPMPVTILSYTHARSMSSLIFQAANKRVMMPHSTFMYHDGSVGIEGTIKQVQTAMTFGKVQDEQMMKIYIDSMKANGKFKHRSRKFIHNYLRDQMDKKEDVYLTAKQAIELGFADQIFDYDWTKLTNYTQEELARG